MDKYTFVGTLHAIRREKNTQNGNPVFSVVIGSQIFTTKRDSSIGYTIESYKLGQSVTATIEYKRGEPILTNIEH